MAAGPLRLFLLSEILCSLRTFSSAVAPPLFHMVRSEVCWLSGVRSGCNVLLRLEVFDPGFAFFKEVGDFDVERGGDFVERGERYIGVGILGQNLNCVVGKVRHPR